MIIHCNKGSCPLALEAAYIWRRYCRECRDFVTVIMVLPTILPIANIWSRYKMTVYSNSIWCQCKLAIVFQIKTKSSVIVDERRTSFCTSCFDWIVYIFTWTSAAISNVLIFCLFFLLTSFEQHKSYICIILLISMPIRVSCTLYFSLATSRFEQPC